MNNLQEWILAQLIENEQKELYNKSICKGEIKIDKDRRNKRIDPVDAVINGYKLMFKVEIRRTDINRSVEKYLEMFKDI